MFSNTPKKHFLNVDYKDKTNQYNIIIGTKKQVTILWTKGSGQRPQTHWSVHMANYEDGERDFFNDPSVKLYVDDEKTKYGIKNQPFSSYLLELPDVSGIQYTVTCYQGDSRKDSNKLKKVAFQTWRRVNLSVECSDQFYYGVFQKALGIVKAAFEEAFIEINLAECTVGNKNATLNAKDSQTSALVKLIEKEWEQNSRLFQFKVISNKLKGTEKLEKIFQKQGDQLILNLGHPMLESKWRLQTPKRADSAKLIESIRVTSEAKEILKIPSQQYRWTPEDEKALNAICRCRTKKQDVTNDAAIQSADEFIIDLTSDPLKLVKHALDQGKEIDVELVLKLEEFGRTGGQTAKGTNAVDIVIDRQIQPDKLANVIAHELGHVFGLTKQNEKNKHDQTIQNPLCYDDRYGGQGNHCAYNAKLAPSASTTSGQTYEFDNTKDRLCVMHFATSDYIDRARFCPTCIKHLRRAKIH